MINLQKGLEDYNSLVKTIRGVKDLNSLVELISDSKTYEITNDLREIDSLIDVNYKSICATIIQKEGYLKVLEYIEVWSDQQCDFIDVNIYQYGNYRANIGENIEISKVSPYDNQEYYWGRIKDNLIYIYRQGKFICNIEKDDCLSDIDTTILKLIELNNNIEPIMCYN